MRHALVVFAMFATILVAAAPAAADVPAPPNQPATYGDCVSASTPVGEGIEDYTVGVKRFVQLVGPPESQRPGLEEHFVCSGFSPPPGPGRPRRTRTAGDPPRSAACRYR